MRLLHHKSPLQTIDLYRDPGGGLVLLMDRTIQFKEAVEYQYHECLVVIPFLFCQPRRVFIGGGGDGLAATRALKYDCVEEVVVCDYDPAITRFAMEHEELLRLNQGSLLDRRVRVINHDAFAYLESSRERFDLVLCDFPDPFFAELGRLYSREFYSLVRQRLSHDGLMVTQTRRIPDCIRIIGSTIRTAFETSVFYGTHRDGFTIGANGPLGRKYQVPEWTRFVSEAYVDCLFLLPKDESHLLVAAEGPINTIDDSPLVRAALLDEYAHLMAYPLCDSDDTWLVELTREIQSLLGSRLSLLLEALKANVKALFLVETGLQRVLASTLEALGLTESTQRISTLCFPLDSASIARLNDRSDSTSQLYVEECSLVEALKLIGESDGPTNSPPLGIKELLSASPDAEAYEMALLLRDLVDNRVTTAFRVSNASNSVALEALTAAMQNSAAPLILEHLRQMGVDKLTLRQPETPLWSLLATQPGAITTDFIVYQSDRTSTLAIHVR